MKKQFIIILVSVLLITGLFFSVKYYQKYKNLEELDGELNFFKLKFSGATGIDIVNDLSDGNVDADISLKIINPTNSQYTVNSIFIEVYTLNDIYIGGQKKAIEDKIVIEKQSSKDIETIINLSGKGIAELVKELKEIGLLQIAKNYLTTEMLGTKIKIKGFISVENLGFLKIKLDEIIDI